MDDVVHSGEEQTGYRKSRDRNAECANGAMALGTRSSLCNSYNHERRRDCLNKDLISSVYPKCIPAKLHCTLDSH